MNLWTFALENKTQIQGKNINFTVWSEVTIKVISFYIKYNGVLLEVMFSKLEELLLQDVYI